ncbi:uncharacterized protein [Oscarella lobularis]|uniref:uncharacterized protein n=1 Tax=Oscarella lobularis TaxID=121494 RepID=UPI003313F1E7
MAAQESAPTETFELERKRLVIPRKLVRPVFGGKEWVMKQIAQDTGAILSLHDCACDERVKLVTAYGPSDSVRKAQTTVNSRIFRALKALNMPVDLLMEVVAKPVTGAVFTEQKKKKKNCYTRSEILCYGQQAVCWKRPESLPDLPCIVQFSP